MAVYLSKHFLSNGIKRHDQIDTAQNKKEAAWKSNSEGVLVRHDIDEESGRAPQHEWLQKRRLFI